MKSFKIFVQLMFKQIVIGHECKHGYGTLYARYINTTALEVLGSLLKLMFMNATFEGRIIFNYLRDSNMLWLPKFNNVTYRIMNNYRISLYRVDIHPYHTYGGDKHLCHGR